MKAQIESTSVIGMAATVRSGRVQKMKKSSVEKKKIEVIPEKKRSENEMEQEDENQEQILAYLAKLQEIVPVMPKNKKLSKVEVIDHVIEYIRELSDTLSLPVPHSFTPVGNKENFSF